MDIRRRVFTNLSRFKDHITDFPPSPKKIREYKVLLDLESGLMRFSERLRTIRYGIQVHPLKNPTRITIIVSNQKDGGALFEIKGTRQLDSEGVAELTLEILNEMAKKIHGVALDRIPEKTVLENLSSVHSQIAKRGIEKLDNWQGELSIEEAENRLVNQKQGDYLIRKGTDVSLMVDQMKENFGFEIYPYSIVFLREDGKIGEKLILGIPQGWILYGDEPDLTKYKPFDDPLKLLSTLGL